MFKQYIKYFRLRTILIVPFIIQIILAVGLTGYLSLQNSHTSVQEFINQLRQELGQKIYNHINAHLQAPMQVNQVVLNSLELGIGDAYNPRSVEMLFQKVVHDFPTVSYLQLGNVEGEFFGYERLDYKQGFNIEIADAQTDYAFNAYATNAQGLLTDKLISSTPNYDPRIRPWYVPAAQSKQATWSNVYVYFDNPRLVVTLSSPVFTEKGFAGIVGTDFSLLEIGNFLQQQQIGKTGQAFIVEKQTQLMIATSTGEKPFIENAQGNIERLSSLNSQNTLTAQTSAFLQQHLTDFNNTSQLLNFTIDGQRYYLQVMPYQDAHGLDWLINVVIPESDFMAQIHENTRLTMTAILIALIIAIIVGLMTANWIVTPICRLNQSAQKLSQGNWNQQLATDSQNEIGELAQSFDSMAKQLKDMFAHLELKVAERTQELSQANEEIQVLNEYLREENQRMGMELEITRQLQQMVLPRGDELEQIQDLEIAGYMQPATEVGGDYYDIIQYGDTVKIAIGDVTGHGLTSGVLMLMVQTAVRTLFMHDMCTPESCLSILNRTIYNNVQRMETDKNLSLTLLNYRHGKVSFVGQHEEVLVIRKNGNLERFDTIDLGFPIGLEANIDAFINRVDIELEPGDGIVLYTDGITEAENDNKQFYGHERFCQIITQNWSLPAKEIQHKIIQDVKQHIGTHKVFDDITLLVIKRKYQRL
jgi:sigma-B regulation protein RsbU (phosphoserine phosphatase)